MYTELIVICFGVAVQELLTKEMDLNLILLEKTNNISAKARADWLCSNSPLLF